MLSLAQQRTQKIWKTEVEANAWIKDHLKEKSQEWGKGNSSLYACYGITYLVQLKCSEITFLSAQPVFLPVFTVTTVGSTWHP